MADSNKFDDNFNKVWAILTRVAARQEQTKAQMAETDKRLNELRVQTAETGKRLNKLMAGNETMQSFIKNDSDACEQHFVDSLDSHDLKVAGVKFDEIYSHVRKKRGGKNIELDALLINGDSVALMEIKKKLHWAIPRPLPRAPSQALARARSWRKHQRRCRGQGPRIWLRGTQFQGARTAHANSASSILLENILPVNDSFAKDQG